MFNDCSGTFHWHGCKQYSDIVEADAFPFFKFYALDLIYKSFVFFM